MDVGKAAAESLSLWSDLATHYAALRWHRVATTQPKGYGNISPAAPGCQNQHALEIRALSLLPMRATLMDVTRDGHTQGDDLPVQRTPTVAGGGGADSKM